VWLHARRYLPRSPKGQGEARPTSRRTKSRGQRGGETARLTAGGPSRPSSRTRRTPANGEHAGVADGSQHRAITGAGSCRQHSERRQPRAPFSTHPALAHPVNPGGAQVSSFIHRLGSVIPGPPRNASGGDNIWASGCRGVTGTHECAVFECSCHARADEVLRWTRSSRRADCLAAQRGIAPAPELCAPRPWCEQAEAFTHLSDARAPP
jgi:hypothetical protein